MKQIDIPVIGLENYQITTTGLLFNKKNIRFRNPTPNSITGYVAYSFRAKGKRKLYLAHRLVAIAFIPNPENKPLINHINGIKTDNRVENLEWCTASENNYHSCRVLGNNNSINTQFKVGHKGAKPQPCEVVKGVKTGIFPSFNAAGRANNKYSKYLKWVASGRIKSDIFIVRFYESEYIPDDFSDLSA